MSIRRNSLETRNSTSLNCNRALLRARLRHICLFCAAMLLLTPTAFTFETSPPDEVATYLEQLVGDDEYRRRFAIIYLMRLSPGSIQPLVEILNDEQKPPLVRAAAAESLGYIGDEASSVVPDLAKAISNANNDAIIRFTAGFAFELLQGPQSKAAVPALKSALSDNEVLVRHFAARALGTIGPDAADAATELTRLLEQEQDQVVIYQATSALGLIGPLAKAGLPSLRKLLVDQRELVRLGASDGLGGLQREAVPALSDLRIRLKSDKSSRVRASAAISIARIAPYADELHDLVETLSSAVQPSKEADATVRRSAAGALAALQDRALSAVPVLTEALTDGDVDVEHAASDALLRIAEGLAHVADGYPLRTLLMYLTTLDASCASLAKRGGNEQSYTHEQLQDVLTTARNAAKRRYVERVTTYASEHPYIASVAAYPPFVLGLWGIILWIAPLSLLTLNQTLQPIEVKLPDALGGTSLSLRTLLLLDWFQYRTRILDKWVDSHSATVRDSFAKRETVRSRTSYIPLAVETFTEGSDNGPVLVDPTPKSVREMFRPGKGCLVIYGEGGLGKTTLACEIGKWALWDQGKQLFLHKALPVLIEHDLQAPNLGQAAFLAEIKGQIQSAAGIAEPLDDEFLDRLLRSQRVLVIVDHLSEMTKATRDAIRPTDPQFPVNALVVTSRINEELSGASHVVIRPTRVEGNKISNFVDAYLRLRGKREILSDDAYFSVCRRLSGIVGAQKVTALLAKMFAEVLIAEAGSRHPEGDLLQKLPKNVPELMISYLNELNQIAQAEAIQDDVVRADLKRVAWECVRSTFQPRPISRARALQVLDGEKPEERLEYLEKRLQLVRKADVGGERIEFTLDPVAEYLAALKACDDCSCDFILWETKILTPFAAAKTQGKVAGQGEAGDEPDRGRGFRLALIECCRATKQDHLNPADIQVLENVLERLNGLNGE
jgi:HEAT repeat protein